MNAIGTETDAVQYAPFHGGSFDWAEARFGPQPEGWLDLSTGITTRTPIHFASPPISVRQRLPEYWGNQRASKDGGETIWCL